MSWATGSQAASATPATDLVATITTAMSSWTFIETVTAANAGTTADCDVWEAPGGDWYLVFEVDNTNARVRVRAAKEKSGTGATFKLNRYIDAVSSAATNTSQADQFRTNTAATIVNAGYVQVLVSASGTTYWLGVGAGNGSAQDLIFFGTNTAGQPQTCLVGFFTPTSGSDSFPLFMATDVNTAANSQWASITGAGGSCRVAYEYLARTAGEQGLFCYSIYSHRIYPFASGAFGDAYSSPRNAYTSDGLFVGDAYFNGISSTNGDRSANSTATVYAAERGTLPGFVMINTANTSPKIGDTVTAGGTTYTILMSTSTTTHTTVQGQTLMVDTTVAF